VPWRFLSDGSGIVERMFDTSLVEQICTVSRAENQAAARRLRLIGELFVTRRAEHGEEEHWAVDTWAAVGAELAAALHISLGRAGSYIAYGLAMRRRPSPDCPPTIHRSS